jgi:hypothetical protein
MEGERREPPKEERQGGKQTEIYRRVDRRTYYTYHTRTCRATVLMGVSIIIGGVCMVQKSKDKSRLRKGR